MLESRPVFLLTDFGAGSHYPGIMRAVVLGTGGGGDGGLRVEDLSHGVRAGDVLDGAFVLDAAWDYLPPDAVVAAVVDPGVGSPRRALALTLGARNVVAPDNGLVTGLLARGGARIHEIRRPDLELPGRSHTFHGRDVFAPVAAHVARGVPADTLGPSVTDAFRLAGWDPEDSKDGITGRVIHVDTFGNIVTNVRRAYVERLGGHGVIEVRGARIAKVVRTYADVPHGALLGYIGSSDRLEIAVRDGRADVRLGLACGDSVVFTTRGAS